MIPKIIHYCWLGEDSYPEKIQHCIDSWKRVLPDYQICLWDTKRFDINQSIWVKEAFEKKKYAFAADYIRCYALYTEGGIYLDSDVEVLKKFDDLLELPYFMGKERVSGGIEAATMGAEKGMPLMKELLEYYDKRHFVEKDKLNDKVMPKVMQEVIGNKYIIKPISSPAEMEKEAHTLCVLPSDYFSPKENEKLYVTDNTYSIHHYSASWRPAIYNVTRRIILRVFGERVKITIGKLLRTYLHKKQ